MGLFKKVSFFCLEVLSAVVVKVKVMTVFQLCWFVL